MSIAGMPLLDAAVRFAVRAPAFVYQLDGLKDAVTLARRVFGATYNLALDRDVNQAEQIILKGRVTNESDGAVSREVDTDRRHTRDVVESLAKNILIGVAAMAFANFLIGNAPSAAYNRAVSFIAPHFSFVGDASHPLITFTQSVTEPAVSFISNLF